MYIKTKGRPGKIPPSLCREAARWYGRKLLGERIYHNIELILDFKDPDVGNDLYGFCLYHPDEGPLKKFTISLNPNLSKKACLTALAHEMVHLKQYAKGELKDYARVKSIKWKGQVYDEDRIDYWDHPWEIEAYGRERGLYVRFIEYKKIKGSH